MKIFLFYVNNIVGLDEWTDRKLIYKVDSLIESTDTIQLVINTDEPIGFRQLVPSRSYALQFEEGNQKELKYFSLRAFQITPPAKASTSYDVLLHVTKIEL
jgi:hypothetical protein